MITRNQKPKRVYILGAGVSGVSCARVLKEHGFNPIILEARDRCGGRLKQYPMTQNLVDQVATKEESPEILINLGANWVHGLDASVNPLYTVANKLNLDLFQTSSDDEPGADVTLFDKHTPVSAEVYASACKRYEWIRSRMDISMHTQRDVSLRRSMLSALEASVAEFGPLEETENKVFNWFFDRLSIDMGVPISNINRDSYDEGESDGASGEGLIRTRGGFFQIFQHLLEEYELDIRLNHKVTCVRVPTAFDEDQTVYITLGTGEVLPADAMVVTIPVGVLQSGSIQWPTGIPRPIADICCAAKAGLMNVVWLWYPFKFWASDVSFLGVARADDEPVTFSTFLAPPMEDQHGNPQAVLMCQVVGDFALAIELMTPAEIAAHATDVLRKMLGVEAVPDAVGCQHSSWGTDEFSRGSYTHVANSSLLRVRRSRSVEFDLLPFEEQYCEDAAAAVAEEQQAKPQSPTGESVTDFSDEQYFTDLDTGYSSSTLDSSPTNRSSSSPEDDDYSLFRDRADPRRPIQTTPKLTPAVVDCDGIFYAGEAVSTQHRGTAHGAYISGAEGAHKLMNYLSLHQEKCDGK